MLSVAIALYTLTVFTAVLAVVGLSGFYPVEARPAALRQPGGPALIHLLTLVVLALLATAAWLAVTALPWTAAVIAGGLAILFAPAIFESLPRRFWDSRAGVAVTAGGAICLLLAIHLAAL